MVDITRRHLIASRDVVSSEVWRVMYDVTRGSKMVWCLHRPQSFDAAAERETRVVGETVGGELAGEAGL